MLQELKRCNKCKIEKPLNDFYRHKSSSDGLTSHCKPCVLAHQKEYRESDKAKEIRAAYRQRNRDRISQQRRKLYAKDKEKFLAMNKRYRESDRGRTTHAAYHQRNHDRIREQDNSYHQRNHEKTLQRKHETYLRHKDEWRARTREYKAKIRGSIGKVTAEEWRHLLNQFGGHCLCCWEKLPLTMDHIVPVSRGGNHIVANVQPLCLKCNVSKGIETVDYRSAAILKLAAQSPLMDF